MGALPLNDSGKVLLAKRAIEPFYGDWNTIGGFLEYQEDPMEGLKREVKEETGVGCIIENFITMNADTYGPGGSALLNSYFTVRLLSSDIHPRDDVSELKWFSMDELPENIAFGSDRKALAALRKKLELKKAANSDKETRQEVKRQVIFFLFTFSPYINCVIKMYLPA
jgi:ADP-ribose pyrophosphatase YjhB (NUDIX family)